MTKYNKTIIFTFFFLALLAPLHEIIANEFEDDQLYLGDKCISRRNSLTENGICSLIEKCPEILQQIRKGINNYTICGYDGFSQVVCCPTKPIIIPPLPNNRSTFTKSVECNVTGTGETGIIKFKSDCNVFNQNSSYFTGQFCDHDICKDLVCCPTKLNTRLKQVCSHVDAPVDEIILRLHLNQECVVTGSNLTGRYQMECDYATRNPHMVNNLKNICNDHLCDLWYCCPIEELPHHDRYYCADEIPLPNVIIVGPKCTDSRTGLIGRCQSIQDCVGYKEDQLDFCGTHCCLNYYCCPNSFQDVANQPLAIQKCWEYSNFVNKREIVVEMNIYKNHTVCDNNSSEHHVSGGEGVKIGEYPHMAALGYELNGVTSWKCGGSLISDEYVLTAAHCLVNNTNIGELKKIQLGAIQLYVNNAILDCPEIFRILRIIRHPDYNTKFVYNDIGLIQLDRKVKFNYHIRPICLPSTSILPHQFQSMGWGATEFPGGLTSNEVLKVNQYLFSHSQCQEYYQFNPSRKINQGILEETQICAGSGHDIQGTCTGDSGGPLLANHPKIHRAYEIFGIVSTGTICGYVNTPGIYTKVYPYKQWIESIVYSEEIV